MNHITIGRIHSAGKIANISCERNDNLENINIENECFLMIVLLSGQMTFKLKFGKITANAPCFVCFDESENPKFESISPSADYFVIYFHPKFLNVNMTFELIRSGDYGDIAQTHDMFLLKPFIDRYYIIPITDNYVERIADICQQMKVELAEQRDWYWSCRGRSYFMEIMIALERLYGLMSHGMERQNYDNTAAIKNEKLRQAVLFIESHYAEPLTIERIKAASSMNHTTLGKAMRDETGKTVMEYLMDYRVSVAKKQLAFTNVPLKEVAVRCGFKTIQHFARVFKTKTGETPADYRTHAVEKRKREINTKQPHS